MSEKDYLLNKTYTCPVCNETVKALSQKSSGIKFINTDKILRPSYKGIDITKYDTICCSNCGYSALTRYFPHLEEYQRRNVIQNICNNFNSQKQITCSEYSYEQAVKRYKLALLCTVKKDTTDSEIGITCLKLAWLLESYADTLTNESSENEHRNSLLNDGMKYSQQAYKYLSNASVNENYPIAGMDEFTLKYLLAALAMRSKDYLNASRYLGSVLTSKSATERLKSKAYDLKQELSAIALADK